MYNTYEHIFWPQGMPFHRQFLQPSEEVPEELEQAEILPAQNKRTTKILRQLSTRKERK